MGNTTSTDLNDNTAFPTVYGAVDKSSINNRKFFSYKLWDISSGSSLSNVLPLNAIYSDYTNLAALGTNLTLNDSANVNGSLQTITYHSIYHLFYKKNQLYNSDDDNIKKFLYQSASILSIPTKKIGLGIKPTSFEFSASSAPYTYNLKDDLYGNVYDISINTSSLIDTVTYYEGFNEYFDTTRINYLAENVSYIPGITLTDTIAGANIGLAAEFNGNGYISTEIDGVYTRDTEFAISFFISGAAQSADNLVLGKLASPIDSRYPFKIELTTANEIKFTIAASNTLQASISASINTDWNHVVCQKSGSKMYLHINGNTPYTASNPAFLKNVTSETGKIDNTKPLYIGGFSTNTSNLTAYIDEIRIFNKALSTSNVNALKDRTGYGTCLQTNIVGNVFYDQGLVVLSSPNPVYQNNINVDSYNSFYRGTKQINEFSLMINAPKDQFNLSMNQSLLDDDMSTYQSFVTGSEFSPYITTIGLYDDNSKLLAIAKLAQPIKKRNDIDLNFLIQIDTDQPLAPVENTTGNTTVNAISEIGNTTTTDSGVKDGNTTAVHSEEQGS